MKKLGTHTQETGSVEDNHRRVGQPLLGAIDGPEPAEPNSDSLNDSVPSPRDIASALQARVFGQRLAVREIAVAISKKLAGLSAGNVLLIGPSGTGKTTVMRAVESFLSSDPRLAQRSTLVRVHANILAQEAEEGAPGEGLLHRLMARAAEQLGSDGAVGALLDRVSHGIVFVGTRDGRLVAFADPSVWPTSKSVCSNPDFDVADCTTNGYTVKAAPELLLDIDLDPVSSLGTLGEPVIANGRVYIATRSFDAGGTLYMLEP